MAERGEKHLKYRRLEWHAVVHTDCDLKIVIVRQNSKVKGTMELKDYIGILWRRKWVILLTLVVTVVVVSVGTHLTAPVYQTTQFYVSQSSKVF
jgi:uncharacterized protein involved in exopolysaccharide biosynthesis